MSDEPRPSLPWETKVALVALALLWLQWLEVVWRHWLDPQGPQDDAIPVAPVLLVTFGIVGIGLLKRSRTAWWAAVLIAGAAGMVFLGRYGPMIRQFVGEDLRGYSVRFSPEHLRWLLFSKGSRIALHLAVPIFLILGRLRESLRAA